MSKWQWCQDQVRGLGNRLGTYKRNVNLTVFNLSHETQFDLHPDAVETVYSSYSPAGNTNLLEPLMERLETAISGHSRPLLIGVITDGLPNVPKDPATISRALVEYTQRLGHPNQVIVVFFQIGDNFDGRAFCYDLSNNLKNQGAKFGICETVAFPELKQEGLVNALARKIFDNQLRELPNVAHLNFRATMPEKANETKSAEKTADKSKESRQNLEEKLLTH